MVLQAAAIFERKSGLTPVERNFALLFGLKIAEADWFEPLTSLVF